MNNIYYRFLHLVEDVEYQGMPARLRMNVLANPGIDRLDFELLSLAVSAINGCGLCVSSHEKKLRQHGITREMIQSAVRIAATCMPSPACLSTLRLPMRARPRPPEHRWPERRRQGDHRRRRGVSRGVNRGISDRISL